MEPIRKVDVIRAGWLSIPIGPSQTMNRIIRNKDIFLGRGYDIRVFSSDIVSPREDGRSVSLKGRIKSKAATFLKRLGRYSSTASELCIKRSLYANASRLIKYYTTHSRNPDIIVFHDFFSCHCFLKHTDTCAKTILFYHNNGLMFDSLLYYYPKLGKSSYYQELLNAEQYVLSKVDKAVFVAEKGRENFLDAHIGFDVSKTLVIHNGIDDVVSWETGSGTAAHPKYRICYVGTFNLRKGQDMALRALTCIPEEKLCDIHISFIGDGDTRQSLEKYAISNGLGKYVSFCGSVKNTEIHSVMCQHNIFMLVSYEEGLPISIIEAMRAGLGIIASNVGGISELVVHGENGVLIEPDGAQLLHVLENLFRYDWVAMGKASRKRFEKEFTFAKMRDSYISMLDNICE